LSFLLLFVDTVQVKNDLIRLNPKHFAKTRWLSFGESLERLLKIWDSLEIFMKNTSNKKSVEKKERLTCKGFLKFFEDLDFKIKISFLSTISNKLNKFNMMFQRNGLEIQHLKSGIYKCVHYFAQLIFQQDKVLENLSNLKEIDFEQEDVLQENLKSFNQFRTDIEDELLIE